MEREDIIRLVTEEVMRRLGTPQPVQPAVKQALALFTGGALGLEDALAQLAQPGHRGERVFFTRSHETRRSAAFC